MQRARAAGASSGRRQPLSPSPGCLPGPWNSVETAREFVPRVKRLDRRFEPIPQAVAAPGQAQPASSLVPLCCRVASFLPSPVDLLPTCVLGAHCTYQPARCVRLHAALRSTAELALACTTASGHGQRSRAPRRSARAAPDRAIAALQAAPEVPSHRQGSAAPARSPGLVSAHTLGPDAPRPRLQCRGCSFAPERTAQLIPARRGACPPAVEPRRERRADAARALRPAGRGGARGARWCAGRSTATTGAGRCGAPPLLARARPPCRPAR
jgi:hypothetical protein